MLKCGPDSARPRPALVLVILLLPQLFCMQQGTWGSFSAPYMMCGGGPVLGLGLPPPDGDLPGYLAYVDRQIVSNARRVQERSQCEAVSSHALLLLAQQQRSLCPAADQEHLFYRPLRMRVQSVLYHQTSWQNAVSILSSQCMRPGRRGRAGAGMYFAFTPDATNAKALSRGVVLEVIVSVGKCMDCGQTPPGPSELALILQDGYDSVTYTTSSGPELVVYSSDQCTPVRAL